MAVSYTHLDVYKRQQVPHARQSGKGLFPSAHGHAQPGDLGKSPGHKGGFCVVATTHAVAATGTAVSYTHLDVYKRQVPPYP